MKIIQTNIKDLLVIEPIVLGDSRGYFYETFKKEWFNKNISEINFIQDNESKSSKGVLRGLHFQNPPFDQSKLVRVIEGEVLDIAVDLRRNSTTYGEHHSIVLSSENKKQFFIPKGFAHGFIVLSETAIFSYKVDNPYSPNHDAGLKWNDEDFNIDWQMECSSIQLSEKDRNLPAFSEFKSPF